MSPLPVLSSRREDKSQVLDLEVEPDAPAKGASARARSFWSRVRGTTGDEDTTNWTDGKQMTARATTAGLWALVALGAAGGAMTFLGPDPAPPVDLAAVQADTQRMSDREDAAREAATEMVSVWASSTQANHSRLEQLVGQDALDGKLPTKALQVRELRAMDADPVDKGVWSVSVSALVKGKDGWQRQAYEVPVMVAGGGEGEVVAASAMQMPSQVPLNAEIADLPASPYTKQVNDGPLKDTVQTFLQALLTGRDGMDRVTAPESPLVAITPAPYKRVEVESVTATEGEALEASTNPPDGLTVHLSVQVRMHTDTKNSAGRPGQYLLTLTSRAGRWEVAQIDDFPATNNTTQE